MQFTFQQAGTGGKRKSKPPTAEEYARYLAAGDADVRKPPTAKGYADYLQTREGPAGRDRDAYDSRVRQGYKERRLAAAEAEKAAPAVQRAGSPDLKASPLAPAFPTTAREAARQMVSQMEQTERRKAAEEKALDSLYKRNASGLSYMPRAAAEAAEKAMDRTVSKGRAERAARRTADDEKRKALGAGVDEILSQGKGAMMTPAQYQALNISASAKNTAMLSRI